jgi:hypothetical protein
MILPQVVCRSNLAAARYGIVSPIKNVITFATSRGHNCGHEHDPLKPVLKIFVFQKGSTAGVKT